MKKKNYSRAIGAYVKAGKSLEEARAIVQAKIEKSRNKAIGAYTKHLMDKGYSREGALEQARRTVRAQKEIIKDYGITDFNRLKKVYDSAIKAANKEVDIGGNTLNLRKQQESFENEIKKFSQYSGDFKTQKAMERNFRKQVFENQINYRNHLTEKQKEIARKIVKSKFKGWMEYSNIDDKVFDAIADSLGYDELYHMMSDYYDPDNKLDDSILKPAKDLLDRVNKGELDKLIEEGLLVI